MRKEGRFTVLCSCFKMPDRFRDAELADLETLVALDSDDEFLDLLLAAYAERDEEREEERLGRHGLVFDFNRLPHTSCVEKYRFAKDDLPTLCHRLGLPDRMTSPGRLSWSGLEGLCLVLARLSNPNRNFDLEDDFSRGRAALSVVFNETLGFLYRRWRHLFEDLGSTQDTG